MRRVQRITILEILSWGGGQGEIENQISQLPLEVPQNPSSNKWVQASFTRIFSTFFISRNFFQFS